MRYWPGDVLNCERRDSIIVYGMMATGTARDEYGDVLNAMVNYVGSYQYYDRAEMAHTLFLKNFWQDQRCPVDFVASIPYPDEWTTHMDEAGTIMIAPADALADGSVDAGPFVRMTVWNDMNARGEHLLVHYASLDDTEYDVPEHEFEIGLIWRRPEPFRTSERQGYVGLLQLCDAYIVELSAPIAAFDAYEPVLRSIANSTWENLNCPLEALMLG